MFSLPLSSMLRLLLLIQVAVLGYSYAYPSSPSSSYIIVPAAESPIRAKRAFDRLEGTDFGFWSSSKRSMLKRALDRLEGTEFGFRKKRAFDRIARADFGLKRKRSFDRISPTSFGLSKRSVDDQREDLVDELTASIMALRKAREAEEPMVILDSQN